MIVVMLSNIPYAGAGLWVGGCLCHVMADSCIVWVGNITFYRSSTHYVPDSMICGKVDHVLHRMARYVRKVVIKGVHEARTCDYSCFEYHLNLKGATNRTRVTVSHCGGSGGRW
jgi:hypothetical protein